jgi:hypothetical protein
MLKKMLLLLLLAYFPAQATTTSDAIRDKGVLSFDWGTSFVSNGFGLTYEKAILPYAAFSLGFEYSRLHISLPQGQNTILWYSYNLKDGYDILVIDNKVDFMLLFDLKRESPWKFGCPMGIGFASYNLKGAITLTDSLGLDYEYDTSQQGVGLQLLLTVITYQPFKHLALAVGGRAFVVSVDVPRILDFKRGNNIIQKDLGQNPVKTFFYPEIFFKLGYVF